VLTDDAFSIFVSVALLRPKPDLMDQAFLTAQLRTSAVQKQIRERSKGIAIRHLHLEDFRELRIVTPGLGLQRTFAARVAEVDKLKAHHRAHLAKLDALFASLQHRAFRGEL